jgi:hypothetical protein
MELQIRQRNSEHQWTITEMQQHLQVLYDYFVILARNNIIIAVMHDLENPLDIVVL